MGLALEKPAEAPGHQSTHRSRGWDVQRRRLKPGRPQDVGSRRGLVGIRHMKEAKRPALLPPAQLREGGSCAREAIVPSVGVSGTLPCNFGLCLAWMAHGQTGLVHGLPLPAPP